MSKEKEIKISKAKGRPMLTWVGKKPLTSVRAYPAQHIESFSVDKDIPLADCDWSDWPDKFDKGGLLFHGDNKDVLVYLLANGFRGKVKLIYIDPPFDSGADYVRKVKLRGVSDSSKIDGEEYTLGEQIQYTDIWTNDNYLQFMYERLLMMSELLHEEGTIYVHCDYRKVHHLRCILDEIFGGANYRSEIIWKKDAVGKGAKKKAGYWPRTYDVIVSYSKSSSPTFHTQFGELTDKQLNEFRYENEDGRKFKRTSLGDYSKASIKKMEDKGYIYVSSSGQKYKKYYLDEYTIALDSIWLDIPGFGVATSSQEITGYPTQKPKNILKRIIESSSNPGDIVFDPFMGSGVAQVVAQEMGRKYIGCDINKGAIQTTSKSLHDVLRKQAEGLESTTQGDFLHEERVTLYPAQSSLNSYCVNDYDLQIQHNEAVELACEFIGITRNRSDSFFDGTRGKKIVKIIPFNHPLTPLDLESIKNELDKRPGEERDIEIICLGMELTAQAWLENHNRNRLVNKFNYIELRTDKKYGGFIKHVPLTASISIKQKKDKLVIECKDVFSPTILQRLNMEQNVFTTQVNDWRAVVDCIMIDTDYDGEVFNVVLSDIPPRKQDFVDGHYELSAPKKGATVAIKIIDMLGEELIITKVIGSRVAKMRRKAKAQKTKGKGALKGLVAKRMMLKAWKDDYEYTASLRLDGTIQYDGEKYDTPNSAAKAALGRPFSGWRFWKYKNEQGEWVSLSILKK